MRVANSPALRPRMPVVSLQQAVSWLGVAEVRNIAMAVMLRGEVFVAPGHEPESEELWREAWLAGLWAKEIARERRKHVESAFLAALMHRTGAALALKILSRFENGTAHRVMDARAFGDLVVEFEPAFGRLLMNNWLLPKDVQDAASDWRNYRESSHSDLAGTVHAAHLLATHTLHPQLLDEELVIESPVFEQLGVFPDDRRRMLAQARSRAHAGGHLEHARCSPIPSTFSASGRARPARKRRFRRPKPDIARPSSSATSQVGGSCLLSGTIPEQGAAGTGAALPTHARQRIVPGRRTARRRAPVRLAARSRRRHRRSGSLSAGTAGAQSGRVDSRPRACSWTRIASRCSAWTARESWCVRRGCFSPPGSRPRHVPPSKWIMNTFSTAIPS